MGDEQGHLTPLDPASPGEWLAAVGLTRWGPGRWVESNDPPPPGVGPRWSPWRYQHDGVIPTATELAEVIEDWAANTPADEVPRSRWWAHRGAGGPLSTASKLVEALSRAPGRLDWSHRTHERWGWEVDASWQRPIDSPDPEGTCGWPTFAAALAFVGALHASRWPGHWPTPTMAVGHLWGDEGPDEHRLDGWVVVWRRRPTPGVAATAGPLGIARERLQLTPPTWQAHVRRHLHVERADLMDLHEVAAHYGLDEAARKKLARAARNGRAFPLGDQPRERGKVDGLDGRIDHGPPSIPAPLGKIEGRPVWARVDIEGYQRPDEQWLYAAASAAQPVGLEEIARRLGVARKTVDSWRQRGVLPEPRWTVGGRPAWSWSDVEAWARQTGRLPDTT